MKYKPDWDKAKERMSAWWAGEVIDRAVIQVKAPRDGVKVASVWEGWNLVHKLEHPEKAVEEFEEHCRATWFGGEAFPNLFINLGPGIVAAYLGAGVDIQQDTVWFESPGEWEAGLQEVTFDERNKWWELTRRITSLVIEMSDEKFFVGMTDLGGNLDIAASLRGAQKLLCDLMDRPVAVKGLLEEIDRLWFRYYEDLDRISQEKMQGTSAWMGIWSPMKWSPLQCDFSAMISPGLFEKFVVPCLERECRQLDHSIYHWDGPGEIPHLEHLLDIPELNGIQWTAGAGNPGQGDPVWFPLYKRIQARGKLLVLLDVEKEQVENVMSELSPEGLLMTTRCDSEEEARKLLARVEQWSCS